MKGLKVLLLAFLAIGLTVNLWTELDKFIGKKTMTTTYDQYYEKLEFPSVTICANPPFKDDTFSMEKVFDITWSGSFGSTIFQSWENSSYFGNNSEFIIRSGYANTVEPIIVDTFYFGRCLVIDPIGGPVTAKVQWSLNIEYLGNLVPTSLMIRMDPKGSL